MGKSYRAGRLSEEIRKIVGNMLLFELKDPRLKNKMVSVSAVEVSDDGSYATVFLTVMGKQINAAATEKENKETLEAMKSASGTIRREIGKNVKLRHVPELTFKIDHSFEYASHMEKIIDGLNIPKDEMEEHEIDERRE